MVADVKYTAAPKLCKLTGNATVDQGSRISWWVMVNSPASQYRYAQVGYLRSGNGSNAAIFTEYNDGTKTDFNTVPQTSWRLDFYTPDPVDGSVHALAVGLNSGGNRLNMTFDGQVLMTTPFDPRVAWPGTWNGQVFAETHDLGDDVPGGKYTPTTFRNIRYWSTYGWGNQVAIVPRSSSADYRNAWAGIDGMDVWTERIDPGCPTCGQG
ncbi:MAG TPA: hypothetical protein VGO92_03050 [Acidimicrobiales bacterium]|nr:hypothetical protein [Acidimicrobiales bacterium]